MPTLFTIFGLRFYFYSEEHQPTHVHVVDSDGRVKIEVEPEIIEKVDKHNTTVKIGRIGIMSNNFTYEFKITFE